MGAHRLISTSRLSADELIYRPSTINRLSFGACRESHERAAFLIKGRSAINRGEGPLWHEDPFPRPGPNGRCQFGEETFADTRRGDRVAPIADRGGLKRGRQQSTQSSRSLTFVFSALIWSKIVE